jgi:hypothetical protein
MRAIKRTRLSERFCLGPPTRSTAGQGIRPTPPRPALQDFCQGRQEARVLGVGAKGHAGEAGAA